MVRSLEPNISGRLHFPRVYKFTCRRGDRLRRIEKEKTTMKKVWKWIIGIVLGLVILAILVGIGFMLFGNFHFYRMAMQNSNNLPQGYRNMMPSRGFGMRMPMMGFGMMPFGGFFGSLLWLGFLVLAVLGIIELVKHLRTPKLAPGAVVQPATMPAVAVPVCKKCGKPIQSDWKVCPYCEEKL
jgi:hypothetical protein